MFIPLMVYVIHFYLNRNNARNLQESVVNLRWNACVNIGSPTSQVSNNAALKLA